jgi:hypothetical protein
VQPSGITSHDAPRLIPLSKHFEAWCDGYHASSWLEARPTIAHQEVLLRLDLRGRCCRSSLLRATSVVRTCRTSRMWLTALAFVSVRRRPQRSTYTMGMAGRSAIRLLFLPWGLAVAADEDSTHRRTFLESISNESSLVFGYPKEKGSNQPLLIRVPGVFFEEEDVCSRITTCSVACDELFGGGTPGARLQPIIDKVAAALFGAAESEEVRLPSAARSPTRPSDQSLRRSIACSSRCSKSVLLPSALAGRLGDDLGQLSLEDVGRRRVDQELRKAQRPTRYRKYPGAYAGADSSARRGCGRQFQSS